MTPTRPIVRYHGGKWKLAPWIISHFPAHRVYVEPFGGGGSVLLRKERSYAEVYNDLDGEIVNLFRMARDHGERLADLLELTPFSRQDFIKAYDVPTANPVEAARNTIIKSFMGFGSNAIHKPTGFRANNNRAGTTPAHDWANYPECFRAIVARLRGVVIENKDAVAVIQQQDSQNTLHYVDPPYVMKTRTDLSPDYAFEMTDTQHVELAAVLNQVQGMVILSGYPSELYDDLYQGWHRIDRTAYADGARERTECLWLNPSACGGQQGKLF